MPDSARKLGCALLALALLGASGCAAGRNRGPLGQFDRSLCDLPPPAKPTAANDGPAPPGYPPNTLRIAEALGLMPSLRRLHELEEEARRRDGRRAAEAHERLRRRVIDEIMLASLEASGIAAELDQEEELAEQDAAILARRQESRQRIVTAAALSLGAAAAVVAGVTGSEAVGIGGAVGEGVLGLILLRKGRDTEFEHELNRLREFRQETPDESAFPGHVWRYLTFPLEDSEGRRESARDRLLREWRELHGVGDCSGPGNIRTTALLLGSGGRYRRDDLVLRAGLLDQLEAAVNLMHGDLRALLSEVIRRTPEIAEMR